MNSKAETLFCLFLNKSPDFIEEVGSYRYANNFKAKLINKNELPTTYVIPIANCSSLLFNNLLLSQYENNFEMKQSEIGDFFGNNSKCRSISRTTRHDTL